MADATTCTSCGNDLADGARFCTRCGTAVADAATPAAPGEPLQGALDPEPAATVADTPAEPAPTTQWSTPEPQQTWAPPQQQWAGPPPQGWAPPPARTKVKGSWPLAPLTVPIALVIGTLLYSLVANAALANITFLDTLDLAGIGAATATFAVVLLLPLMLLSLLRRGPGNAAAAILGVVGTVVAFAGVAVVVSQAVVDNGYSSGQPVGSGQLFSNLPQSLYGPYDLIIGTFFGSDLLLITTDDGVVSGLVILTWAVLMAIVGFGGGLAATGRAKYAVLAGLGGFVGGLLGEAAVEGLFLVSQDAFYTSDGPTPLILLPVVVAGLGIGIGAAIGGTSRAPAPA